LPHSAPETDSVANDAHDGSAASALTLARRSIVLTIVLNLIVRR
jgi:hypothetical protein